jgi:hypothetical protein
MLQDRLKSCVYSVILPHALLSRIFTSTITSLIDPLNTELNLICHLLTLLGAHHILHVSRIRIKLPFHYHSHTLY